MLPKKRNSGYLAQKKLFLVVSEGRNSEPEYFGKILGAFVSERVYVKCLPGQNGTSPDKLVGRLAGYRGTIRATDELWAVADRDQWTDEQRKALFDWMDQGPPRPLRGVVISSPMFEVWLLLHFQDDIPHGTGAIGRALRLHLPDYGKKEGALVACSAAFTLDAIHSAVARAKALCPSGRTDLAANSTNAWVLVERILTSARPPHFRVNSASTQPPNHTIS